MKRFIAFLICMSFILGLLFYSDTTASVIANIKEIQTIGIPQSDFIGSVSLSEVNFYENDFNTKYVFPMQGICVTSDGYIAVIDNAYGRIHVLTPLLDEKFSFGSLKDFIYPTDIAFYNNNFYIVDPFKKEIRIFDKNGVFLKALTNPSFTSPIGIAVVNEYIFVSDYFSNTLFKLNNSGVIISSTKINTPLGAASDSTGRIYVVSGSDKTVYVFNSNLSLVGSFGKDTLIFPSDLVISNGGNIYVVDRGLSSNSQNTPKIAVFNSSFKLINTFGSLSKSISSIQDGTFLTPSGIAVSSTNSVYVFDSGYYFYLNSNPDAPFGYPVTTRLSVFNLSGDFINKKDFIRDSNRSILLNPLSSSLDENGFTWVLNKGNLDSSEILQFNPDGSLNKVINKIGSTPLPSLNSIYADKKGNVLACGNNQIIVFSSSGVFKSNIINANFGLLKNITYFKNYYYATSLDKNVVIKLDVNFKVVSTYPVCELPSGIDFDSNGNAYITSLSDNMVHIFNTSFKETSKFGGPGKGAFRLYVPEDISIDNENNVYIANTENGRISVFSNTGVPLYETPPYYLGLTSIEVVGNHILTTDAFHNVVRVFEVVKQYPDYAFNVKSSPDNVVISNNDFVNIFFTIINTGLKTDSYNFSVSISNSSFKYTLFESSNSFSLLPGTSKRIRVLVQTTGSVNIGDSAELILKVTSINSKTTVFSNAIIKVDSILEESLYIDESQGIIGNNVAVPVYIKNASYIRGISFDLSFDKSKLTFNSLTLDPQFSNSLLMVNPKDTGITILLEFPKENYVFNTVKIGTLEFKTLAVGSSILDISNAKFVTVVDEIKDFKNVFPGSVVITPYLSINLPKVYSTANQNVVITGKTTPSCSVSINGIPINVGSDGSFTYKFTLSSYTTTLLIIARSQTGEETSQTVVINFTGKLKITIILTINDPYMYVNGNRVEVDPGRNTVPIIVPGWNRTVVPIRAIVENIGGSIQWDASKQIVTVKLNNKTIELQIGNNMAKVNGIETMIDPTNPSVKPIIINDRTMVPLRFVAEQLGCNVSWDGVQKRITIEYVFP